MYNSHFHEPRGRSAAKEREKEGSELQIGGDKPAGYVHRQAFPFLKLH